MRALPTLLALSLAAAFGGFAATALRDTLTTPVRAAPSAAATVPALSALPPAVDGQSLPSLAPMLQRVTPTVVSVNTKQRVRVRTPFGDDPAFRRMFNIPEERIAESLGSGVIVDAANGYVLTNHHVIEDADEVSITLADGRTVPADFIGSDADTDVALMRIDAKDLVALPLSRNDALLVGDFVVAVGNPFGVGQTVTSGIVSAVGRSNVPGVGFQNFIQTDASINPGNSGGALVNLKGELVGINTASFNPRGSMAGNIGLGFAIPVGLARSIMDQLIANDGVVRRGTLGLESQTVDARIAQGLGITANRGAVITRVYAGSAAAFAKLQPGDVVTSANGQRIDSAEALRNFQGLQPLDAPVKIEFLREGKPMTATATLREQPRNLAGAAIDARLSGATFAELPEALRRNGLEGVLVEKVDRNSRAAQSGLRENDVVRATSGGEVQDLAGFRSGLADAPGALVLRIQRGRATGDLRMQ